MPVNYELISYTSNISPSAENVNGKFSLSEDVAPVASDDMKYSLSDSLENVEEILYNSNSPLSVVNRATTQNNSSINWVYKAKIFSIEENKQFHEKISQINQGSNAFQQNLSGEYMLPIGNKIVFTDGDYDAPNVRKIVEVLTEHATEFEVLKEIIFDVERGKLGKSEAVRYVQNAFGEGRVISYKGGNNGVYGWQDGKRKGTTRGAVIRNYLNQQHRGRDDFQSENARLNENIKASSKDDAFSLSQNDLAPVAHMGTYNVYGKDIELAPVRKDLQTPKASEGRNTPVLRRSGSTSMLYQNKKPPLWVAFCFGGERGN